jgi:hypothetical protein
MRKLRPPEERFWERVQKTETCWLWIGGLTKAGYGQFHIGPDGKGGYSYDLAHRWCYKLWNGEIPQGLQLDHLCRVRNCVNPEHLEAVTPRVNTLRGHTRAAANAAKTHCPYGHEYSPDNTIFGTTGNRLCRSCWNRNARTRRDKVRAAQKAANRKVSEYEPKVSTCLNCGNEIHKDGRAITGYFHSTSLRSRCDGRDAINIHGDQIVGLAVPAS